MNKEQDKMQEVVLCIVDFICIICNYYLAGQLWLGEYKGFTTVEVMQSLNNNVMIVILAFFVAFTFCTRGQSFIQRGWFEEFRMVVGSNAIMASIIAIYELLKRNGQLFPRGVYVLTIFLNIVIVYIIRVIAKKVCRWYFGNSDNVTKIFIITSKKRLERLEEVLKKNEVSQVSGISVIDEDMKGQNIAEIPIVANMHDVMSYIKNEIVDEVYIDLGHSFSQKISPLVMQLEDMGVVVHIKLDVMENYKDYDTSYGQLWNIPVITFANRFYDWRMLAVKRCMDIVGSLVGIAIMMVAMIFVVPAIKIESKGPVFFKQKRVGKNGRCFYVYKFRSMYVDAEERKKDLMSQNEMQGLMFKMKDDPRITKVGKFIRKTSIDELPQFINVFKGDMSLVGTRPPTVNEFQQYDGHHKRRLSMKPGITGMWQAYGRSTVTDFEEIVKMDLDYIDHWSIALDIKILCRTVIAVFQGN